MTKFDDDSLNGSYTVIKDRLPKPKKIRGDTRSQILDVLSDGKKHSMRGMALNGKIKSQGNLHLRLMELIQDGIIEEGLCECCDSLTKLYKLK